MTTNHLQILSDMIEDNVGISNPELLKIDNLKALVWALAMDADLKEELDSLVAKEKIALWVDHLED